jgi:hypothetical protein
VTSGNASSIPKKRESLRFLSTAYLTEINVTCPTGIQEIDRLDEVRLESDVWDAIENRLGASGRRP